MLEELKQSLYNAGKSDEEIAEITGQKLKTVRAWRYKNKLPMIGKTEIDEETAFKLWQDGLTDKEIAKHFGCKESTIMQFRRFNELGANNHIFDWQHKLKPSELAKIPQKYWNPRFRKVNEKNCI